MRTALVTGANGFTASYVCRQLIEKGYKVRGLVRENADVKLIESASVEFHYADLAVDPQAVLDVPRLGCWNIHASLLPRWRGAAPVQRAILAGDATTGITIMQMDAGLDTGLLLLVRSTPIGPRESGGSLHDRLSRMGAAAIVAAIEEWQAGHMSPQPQPAQGATYAGKLRKEEARIDWTLSAEALDRLVRAFNPWPVAETTWDGKQLRIWAAEPEPRGQAASRATPGSVLESAGGRIVVARRSATSSSAGSGCIAATIRSSSSSAPPASRTSRLRPRSSSARSLTCIASSSASARRRPKPGKRRVG